jgi:deoxycytidine triphosphate deaminase
MSVLSSRQIKALITDESVKLIEPDEEQLNKPKLKAAWDKGLKRVEGVNFELSLDKVFRKEHVYSNTWFIGVEERRTPSFIEEPAVNNKWILNTGFYELKTFETINQPLFLASRLVAKRTVITFGTLLVFADVAPGYSGKLGIGLYVFPGCCLPIERGALFASISFSYILDAEGVEKWQGVWGTNTVGLDKAERPR